MFVNFRIERLLRQQKPLNDWDRPMLYETRIVVIYNN